MNQNQFSTAPVKVLNRSAFDKSHKNFFTSKVGTLTPVLVDELIPGSIIDLKSALSAKLAPLASDTFMNCRINVEAFYVPYRILWAGFPYAAAGQTLSQQETGAGSDNPLVPRLYLTANSASFTGPGSLADFLGMKSRHGLKSSQVTPDNPNASYINIFPFLAYHRVYDDFYRPALLEKPVFAPTTSNGYIMRLPFMTALGNASGDGSGSVDPSAFSNYDYGNFPLDNVAKSRLGNGRYIYEFEKRHFGVDYFASATPRPTIADTPVFQIDTSGASTSFTISALRAVNSLTQFAERNALAGSRYDDWLKANYGVNLSADVMGKSHYLGRTVVDIVTNGVAQVAPGESTGSRNPFETVGAQYGDAAANGSGDLFDNYEVVEPGLLMVLASLTPKPSYSTGIRRYLTHFTKNGWRADVANQIFENVGPQPIYGYELNPQLYPDATGRDSVFGYTDRYAEFKTMYDEVHGLLRDGSSLYSFALQRSFEPLQSGVVGTSPEIGVNFTEILDGYLENVMAVSSSEAGFDYWCDMYFDYKVVQPLSRYSQPSFVMPADLDGHFVDVKRAGYHW